MVSEEWRGECTQLNQLRRILSPSSFGLLFEVFLHNLIDLLRRLLVIFRIAIRFAFLKPCFACLFSRLLPAFLSCLRGQINRSEIVCIYFYKTLWAGIYSCRSKVVKREADGSISLKVPMFVPENLRSKYSYFSDRTKLTAFFGS